jgi:predicted metal-dependent HD superfamily phosphohydrolase
VGDARSDLETRFVRLLGRLGADPGEAGKVFADLAARHGSPDRHYHTLDHVRAVLDALEELGADPERDPALFLAAWFHDAVYDTHAADNEEQSARLAAAVLPPLGVPRAVTDEATRLILLTKHHQTGADDAAGERLLDADLTVLGAAPDVYDCYAAAIRREFAWVSEADYSAGRSRVLSGFLGRPGIYRTAAYRESREAQARENLSRERAALSG